MAGRKNFVAGEILTASDVNSFLMDQSVMVFDDGTARGSAIPSPIEGMVTYLKSDDQVTVFDGSAFKPVGGLVAVKEVLKTNEFSASVASGDNVAVTGLSITHEVQDPANRLIISAWFGAASSSSNNGGCGLAVAEDGTLIGIGDVAGSRVSVGAGSINTSGTITSMAAFPSVTFVHTPGAGSKTYTVRALRISTATGTLTVNRSFGDSNTADFTRSASGLVIQEVAV